MMAPAVRLKQRKRQAKDTFCAAFCKVLEPRLFSLKESVGYQINSFV